jgi:hypothetical protein
MLHGNVGVALRCNLLLVLSVPVVAGFAIRYAWLKQQHRPVEAAIRPVWIYVAAAALVVFSVLRNLPVEQFSCLRP